MPSKWGPICIEAILDSAQSGSCSWDAQFVVVVFFSPSLPVEKQNLGVLFVWRNFLDVSDGWWVMWGHFIGVERVDNYHDISSTMAPITQIANTISGERHRRHGHFVGADGSQQVIQETKKKAPTRNQSKRAGILLVPDLPLAIGSGFKELTSTEIRIKQKINRHQKKN